MSHEAAVGIAWKVVSAMFFTAMLTIVKMIGDRFPVGEMLFARNFFGLIPVLMFIAFQGGLADSLKTDNLSGHIKRATAGMFAMGLWFAALQRLSFPEATAIIYAAPLMMVVLAATVLGEKVRIYRWSAVGIGFVGVFFILVPQFENGFDVMHNAAAFGACLALTAAVFMSITSVFVRQLAQTENTGTVVLYFLLAGSAVTLLTFPTWVIPSWSDAMLLVLIGILGGIGQLCITRAFHHAEASLIAPFEYTSMIWVVSVGYFIFDEIPSVWVLVGATIVIASGIFVILRERQLGLPREERKVGSPLRP